MTGAIYEPSFAACLVAAHLCKDMEVPVCLLHTDQRYVAGCDWYSVLPYMVPRGEILKGSLAEVWAVEDRHGCGPPRHPARKLGGSGDGNTLGYEMHTKGVSNPLGVRAMTISAFHDLFHVLHDLG